MEGVHVKCTLAGALNKSDDSIFLKSSAGLLPGFHIGRNLDFILVKQILVDPQITCIDSTNTESLQLTVNCHCVQRNLTELVSIIITERLFDSIRKVDRRRTIHSNTAICRTGGALEQVNAFSICQSRLQSRVIVIDRDLLPGNVDIRIFLIEFRDVLFIYRRTRGPAPPYKISALICHCAK